MKNPTTAVLKSSKLQILTFSICFIAMEYIDTTSLDLKQWLLIAVAGCSGFWTLLILWKHEKAEKAWKKEQSADFSLIGAPKQPETKHLVSQAVSFTALACLLFLGMHPKDAFLAGGEWWMLALLPVTVAGFWYTSKIKKTYDMAYFEWRQAQSCETA